MHVMSGEFKGRTIKRPEGIRVTQDKVRKALFDILGNIKGLSFLDLYAGSGAVGIEALSLGVSKVVFVDRGCRCIRRIKQNLSVIGLFSEQISRLASCRIIGLDVIQSLKLLDKSNERFEIIFLDPPYYQDLAKKTLIYLIRYDILAPNGLIICQHFKKDFLPKSIGQLSLIKQAKYGDTFLSFYKKQ